MSHSHRVLIITNTTVTEQLSLSSSVEGVYLRCDSMTLLMKLTMAEAGCSGSSSANRWHTFSARLPGFLATNPKTLTVALSVLVHLLSLGSMLLKVTLLTG